jgi:hypothetical protein
MKCCLIYLFPIKGIKMPIPKGLIILTLAFMLIGLYCSGPEADQPLLTAELPLHLEGHINDARIEGSEVPGDVLQAVEWSFDKIQPEWKAVSPLQPSNQPALLTYTDDALRITLAEKITDSGKRFFGGSIYTSLPGWDQQNWDFILVSARTKDDIAGLWLEFNLRKRLGTTPREKTTFLFSSDSCEVIKDGSVHTYLLQIDRSGEKYDDALEQLGIQVMAGEPANIDILSVKAIPKEALYSDIPVGLSTDVCSDDYRRTLFIQILVELGLIISG